jgi:hypothetical protein
MRRRSWLALAGAAAALLAPAAAAADKHRVLGRQGYKLGPARRVPLGTFTKGRHAIRWDLKVSGRRLAPGRYLVTPRAVTAKTVVRELARPRVIRVR